MYKFVLFLTFSRSAFRAHSLSVWACFFHKRHSSAETETSGSADNVENFKITAYLISFTSKKVSKITKKWVASIAKQANGTKL